MVYITNYPIIIDGSRQGEMRVEKQGVYTYIRGEFTQYKGIVRLYAFGDEKQAYLGIAENRNGKSVYSGKFSDAALRDFPDRIEYFGNSGRTVKEEKPAVDSLQDRIWYRQKGGVLVTEINGKKYAAFPAKLKNGTKCLKSVTIEDEEYVVFPR